MTIKNLRTAIAGLLLTPFISGFIAGTASAQSTDLSCPDKPNCVSSQAQGDHYIQPLDLQKTTFSAIQGKLEAILNKWPETEILSTDDNEIHAVITSRWMGFKDDLVLIVNPDGIVDVRSSSRTGYYDFGVNRKRVEQLRAELTK